MNDELKFGASSDEIEAAFSPFVVDSDETTDRRWLEGVAQEERNVKRRLLRRRLLGPLPWSGVRRTQQSVSASYSAQWIARPFEMQLSGQAPAIPCMWGNRRMFAQAVGTKRVHLLQMMNLVEQIEPASILEVGSGNGLNLLSLAARFPRIRLHGVELSDSGVAVARQAAESTEARKAILAFSPQPPVDQLAMQCITFEQGDARSLPFQDASFDLVFTCLALEQMEEIRPQAISEVARVARTWVAMIEPFRDFNDEGVRRRYIKANDYFAGHVSDLRDFGLEPVLVTADMPHKITLKPGLVLARKV